MPDKIKKVDDTIAKGKKVAGVAKDFTPPVVDGIIEQGEQMVDTGWGLAKMLGGLFGGKFKKKHKIQ